MSEKIGVHGWLSAEHCRLETGEISVKGSWMDAVCGVSDDFVVGGGKTGGEGVNSFGRIRSSVLYVDGPL